MTPPLPTLSCDLLVIGSGMAGMSAALFAADRNISTIVVGKSSTLNYASGLLDLLAVHPIGNAHIWDNPWEALQMLAEDLPQHPYAKINPNDINAAFTDILHFLEESGIRYHYEPRQNIPVITPAGTVKTTYAIPESMLNGVHAYREKAACILIDFKGMKGFSARQIAETLKDEWPALTTKRLRFPGISGEFFPEHAARELEQPKVLKNFVEHIRPHIKKSAYVGLPAILGIHQPTAVYREFEDRLGYPVFEIPTMPPSISGSRLKKSFKKQLAQKWARYLSQHEVLHFDITDDGTWRFEVGPQYPRFIVQAKGALLATGRFFGKGLHADRNHIKETVFGLPIAQPHSRKEWHRRAFLDRNGNTINQVGIDTDAHFRPVDVDGRVLYNNLFSAGSILAHQDWGRMKCGSGLAIATAYAAVNAFQRLRSI